MKYNTTILLSYLDPGLLREYSWEYSRGNIPQYSREHIFKFPGIFPKDFLNVFFPKIPQYSREYSHGNLKKLIPGNLATLKRQQYKDKNFFKQYFKACLPS